MHIVMVDDSTPFDGFTPSVRPLGGAEKAFAGLAGALARRGHDVRVINRARYAVVSEGAHWETMEKAAPAHCDVLIAYRKPTLLPLVRLARRRILWLTATSAQLAASMHLIADQAPILVLSGKTQQAQFTVPKGVEAHRITPGLRQDFLDQAPTIPETPPYAVVTTHPMHGLDWALDFWMKKIHPDVPGARLVVVSALMHKALSGQEIPENLIPLAARLRDLQDHGVEVRKPMADSGMAALYRAARFHLYPGSASDVVCWTLLESQATGLPAIARPLGAVPERVENEETGFVSEDDDVLAKAALALLGADDSLFWRLNQTARTNFSGRDWDQVAADFEALF